MYEVRKQKEVRQWVLVPIVTLLLIGPRLLPVTVDICLQKILQTALPRWSQPCIAYRRQP